MISHTTHGPGLRRTSVHPGRSVAVHADRFGGLQKPIGAGAGGQGWPGTPGALATWRDRWKLWDDLVENTAPTKVEKLKVATDFWLDLTVLSFLEVAIYMMSCMMHVETSQTNSMLAVKTDSQCSQCYVHVLSLFLLLIDDSLGDYS